MRIVLVVVVTLLAAARSASAHPQDGPHTDLRLQIGADALVVQISMNLVFLDATVETVREDPGRIDESERAGILENLVEYFRANHPVTIDGVRIDPEVAGQLVVNDPDESLLPLFPTSGERGLRKCQTTLRYPFQEPPDTVSIVWSVYPPDILADLDPAPPLVIMAELVAYGMRRTVEFHIDEPEFTWHRPPDASNDEAMRIPVPRRAETVLAIPVLSIGLLLTGAVLVGALTRGRLAVVQGLFVIGLLGGAIALRGYGVVERRSAATDLPDETAAAEVFEALHRLVYHAFDYVDESDIYDVLATAVDGPLLDRLYREVYHSLVMQEEGGAVSHVQAVRALALEIGSIGVVDGGAPGFTVRYRYQVDGQVVHWGHSHERTSEYDARYVVMATAAGWRIGAVEMLEQFHVDPDETGDAPIEFDGTIEL